MSRAATAGPRTDRPRRLLSPASSLAFSILVLAFLAARGWGGGSAPPVPANPDPEHISGEAGAERLVMTPRGDLRDADNLQWAVDQVAPGGVVELGAGTFFLGTAGNETAPPRTVVIAKGLTLHGRRDSGGWSTVVRGGGAGDCGPTGIESGPFLIRNDSDRHPVVIEHLWLREWIAEAVCIEAVRGFTFRNNRLSHPRNTTKPGAIRFVHALWTTGGQARGDFVAEGNLVELGNYEGERADDEQFLGVFFSNHDTIRVSDNTITGIDEAIEIIGNRVDQTARGEEPPAAGPSEIVVRGNRIDVTQQPGDRWPSTFGILVAGNRGAQAVQIEGNDLAVRGKGYAFGLSGDRLRVADNRVRFEEFEGAWPAGVFWIGFGELAGLPMGAALYDSVIENNTFAGRVRDVGIVFRTLREGQPNDSHGNRFDLGTSLAALGAETTLVLPATVHDNEFLGTLPVIEDDAPAGANRYPKP